MMVACGGPEPTPTILATTTPIPSPGPTQFQSPSPVPTTKQVLDDPRVLMDDFLRLTLDGDGSAARVMGASGDVSFIPVLIELMRFPWELDHDTKRAVVSSLAELIGQSSEPLAPKYLALKPN